MGGAKLEQKKSETRLQMLAPWPATRVQLYTARLEAGRP
jgi:hypothetical protein